MTVTFEPLSFFAVFTLNGTLPPSVLDHAPHCFTRDIDINAVQYANQANVSNLLYNQPNYEAFTGYERSTRWTTQPPHRWSLGWRRQQWRLGGGVLFPL